MPVCHLYTGLLLLTVSVSSQVIANESLYYDYIDENGQLQGGIIRLEENNALHQPLTVAPWQVALSAPEMTLNSETIQSSGNPMNRIDLTLLGDGYTEAELPLYAEHAVATIAGIFSESPFNHYQSYFNVHRVDVISTDSGVTHDSSIMTVKDTALDMQFWCSDTERLLCIDVNKANVAASNAPAADQILALANSEKYGGAGYPQSGIGTVSGNNKSSIQLGLHEFGHAFAGLADEYEYGGEATYTGAEPVAPNITTIDAIEMMIAQQQKWYRWLDYGEVGLFAGGNYSQFGVYRPTKTSKMRNVSESFGPINSEALIISIYEMVSPIDDATPAGRYLLGDELKVSVLEPNFHSLDIQWFLNEQPIVGANDPLLDTSGLVLAQSENRVSVRVTDNTPLVRDEHKRQLLMSDHREWVIDTVESDNDKITGQFQLIQSENAGKLWVGLNAAAVLPPTGEVITSYDWRSSDGQAIAPLLSTSATFTQSGQYQIELNVTDSAGHRYTTAQTFTVSSGQTVTSNNKGSAVGVGGLLLMLLCCSYSLVNRYSLQANRR